MILQILEDNQHQFQIVFHFQLIILQILEDNQHQFQIVFHLQLIIIQVKQVYFHRT